MKEQRIEKRSAPVATLWYVTALPIVGLIVMLSARDTAGIEADPVRIGGTLLAGLGALAISVRHPAALVVPVLFLPRLMTVDALSGFGEAAGWTTLQVAVVLLVSGAVLRRLFFTADFRTLSSPGSPGVSRMRLVQTPLLFFACFVGIVAISYLYTPSLEFGARKLTGFLSLGCLLFGLPLFAFFTEDDFRDLAFGGALFGIVVAASSLSFSATGAMGAGENAAHIGKGQAIGLAILFILYSPIAKNWLRIAALFACIPWLALGMVSAETRGPLFGLMFVLILSFFVDAMRSPLVSRRQMAIVGFVLLGAVFALSGFWFYGAEAFKFKYKADEILALLQGSSEARGTAVQRLGYYSAALESWWQHPVFGWGVGGWSMAYWRTDDHQYPHNLLLEVLVEQGALGLGLLLLFFMSVFKSVKDNLSQVSSRIPFLVPCGVYLLAISMFSGDLDDDRFLWFWSGLILTGCAFARVSLLDPDPAGDNLHEKYLVPRPACR